MYAYGNRLWFFVNYLERVQGYIYDMTAHTVTEEPKEIADGIVIGDRMLVFEVPEGYDDTSLQKSSINCGKKTWDS